MKKQYLFFCFFVIVTAASSGQTGSDAFHNRASALFEQKKYAAALQVSDSGLAVYPANVSLLMLKAKTLEWLSRPQEAVDIYSGLVQLYPDSLETYNQLGLLFSRMGRTDLALAEYKQLLKREMHDTARVNYLVQQAWVKFSTRDFTGAYLDCLQAYEIDSLDPATLNNLAIICDEVGKPEETLGYLYRLLKLDSTAVSAYVNIGFKMQLMENHAEAIRYFNKALTLQPDEPLSLNNRGYSKLKTGDLDGALKDINQSILLYPANAYAFRNRALVYLAKKNSKMACADIDEGLRLGFTERFGDELKDLKWNTCK